MELIVLSFVRKSSGSEFRSTYFTIFMDLKEVFTGTYRTTYRLLSDADWNTKFDFALHF
jgi:hypothetical protein